MFRPFASAWLAAVCFGIFTTSAVLRAEPQTTTEPSFAGVSLKIGQERVPPGGLAQVKLFVTEPRPITTGFASLDLDGLSEIVGLALSSPARDTLGVALIRGSQVSLSVLSPSATFAMDPDYPVFTAVVRVPATTPLGSVFRLDMDAASLQFIDPSGVIYPNHFKGGSVRVELNVGVDDVVPGSADVETGDVVTVVGRGFVPETKVKLKEVLVSNVTYVDQSHMRVTLGQPVRMHGTGVIVSNPDGAQTKYFSYQRTAADATSLRATLRDAFPIFADRDVSTAVVDVKGAATGLAIQNRQNIDAVAAAELLDAAGSRLAKTSVKVPPSRFMLLELSELFGRSYAPGQIVRVRSLVPVQVMGVAVDRAGAATPLPSR
jgi:hypothetical protein